RPPQTAPKRAGRGAPHHSPRTDATTCCTSRGTAMKCAMCWETTYGHVSRI
ncbi:hypothetical protein ALC56_09274, partial [Trachymyrmex septentrionalis]